MKNYILILLIFTLIACGSKDETTTGESEEITEAGKCSCEQIKLELDSLKIEVNNLRKHMKRGGSANTNNSTTTNKTHGVAFTKNGVVGKRDSDGSIRCSVVTKGHKCIRRTFSRNGLCAKHGGDEPITK